VVDRVVLLIAKLVARPTNLDARRIEAVQIGHLEPPTRQKHSDHL